MNVAPCSTYHAVPDGTTVLNMPDGRSVFKIYYISIVGRDKPETFEWEHSVLTKEEFEKVFLAGGHEGVGFVTAFPHVAKIFRFSPQCETVMDVAGFHTVGMKDRPTSRGDGFDEFACYGEAIIAAEEYHAWAKAESVAEYMEFRCEDLEFPVASNSKLGEYWG